MKYKVLILCAVIGSSMQSAHGMEEQRTLPSNSAPSDADKIVAALNALNVTMQEGLRTQTEALNKQTAQLDRLTRVMGVMTYKIVEIGNGVVVCDRRDTIKMPDISDWLNKK